MSTPPLLLAAAALLWGFESGAWIPAIAAALAMEAPRVLPSRWPLTPRHFERIADASLVALAAAGVYFYATAGMPRAMVLAFEWLPFFALPLALAQAFARVAEIELAVVVPTLRRARFGGPYRFNMGYPLLLLWILGASAASLGGPSFYVGMVLLCTWAIVAARPRTFPLAAPIAMLAAAGSLGFAGHVGLHQTQLWLESAASDWFNPSGTRTNPYRSSTDIGSVGKLKESQQIVLRVRSDRALDAPLLLHRASYDGYAGSAWVAHDNRFDNIAPDAPGDWPLGEGSGARRLTIFESARSGDPVLSIPAGATRVRTHDAAAVTRNAAGTVQARMEPGDLAYELEFVEGAAASAGPPVEADRVVPRLEQAAIRKLADDLGLAGLPPAEALRRLHDYFERNFTYATKLEAPPPGTSPLAHFLATTHAGHCEYFATATTLVLRAAGIPARYATGFALSEFSKLEGMYVARSRHAHAWTRAWIDGAWRDVDDTPPVWLALEDADAPFWAPLEDLVAWARFRLARAVAATSPVERWAFGALVVLVISAPFLRKWLRRRKRARKDARRAAIATPRLGLDSEFFAVERRIAELGSPRAPSESPAEWLRRIAERRDWDAGLLAAMAALHARHRFDPEGLTRAERERLRAAAQAWLERFRAV